MDLYSEYYNGFKKFEIEEVEKSYRYYDKYFAQFIDRFLNPRVLDLGCGYGMLLSWLLKKKKISNICGIDFCEDIIGGAQRLGVEDFILIDNFVNVIRKLSADSYEIIFALDVLEHFDKIQILEIVSNVHSLLTQKGLFIIRIPNGDSPFVGEIFYGDLTHKTLLNKSSMFQLSIQTKFSKIFVIPDFGINFTLEDLFFKCIYNLAKLRGEEKIWTKNIICVLEK